MYWNGETMMPSEADLAVLVEEVAAYLAATEEDRAVEAYLETLEGDA